MDSDEKNRKVVEQLEHLHCYEAGPINFSGDKPHSLHNTTALLPCHVDFSQYTIHREEGSSVKKGQADRKSIADLLKEHGRPIEIKKIVYEKPLAVIYNPVSGRKIHVKNRLRSFLDGHSIQADFFETKYILHAWDLAEREISLDNYSAVVAVGGDGTFHEVVNGLMNRKDGLRLPVGFVPNGTGNDTVMNFGVTKFEQALDFIVKGDLIKIDMNLVTCDAMSPEDVPAEQKRDRVRYCIANSAAGLVANVVHKAYSLKQYIGGLAYPLTGLKEVLFDPTEDTAFNLCMEMPDGSEHDIQDLQTSLMFVNNGKFAGGQTCYTPSAMLNDGLLDVVFYERGRPSFLGALSIIAQASFFGKHVYRDDIRCFRAKAVTIAAKKQDQENKKVTAPSVSGGESSTSLRHNLYQVDGECFAFTDYVYVEALREVLEIILDYDSVMA